MAGPTNGEIMQKLGELSGLMQGVQKELASATESRKILYEKIEEQNGAIRDVQFEAEKQTGINAQVRDAITELKNQQSTTNNNIKPLLDLKAELPTMVDNWRDLRKTGQRLVWLLSIGGVSVTAAFIWFGSIIAEWLRHWLGLPPST